MKKFAFISLLVATSIGLWAVENSNGTEVRVSINTMSMDYMEYKENGDKFDSEKTDALPGFSLGYKTKVSDGLDGDGGYIDTELSHFYGNTEYIGSYQGGTYGDLTLTTRNRISEAAIGYSENKAFEQGLWFVRVGMGYRYWERELADGHIEEYYWPYGSLSTGLTGSLSADDNLGIEIEYHRAFSPQMKSNLYGTFDLGRTDGYSISIPWVHTITQAWALQLAYTYKTWDIEASNKIHFPDGSIVWEPRSESNFNIFNAALIYRY